jgi:hypothetical protein
VRRFETPEMLAMAWGASSSARPSPTLNQPKPFANRFALEFDKPGFEFVDIEVPLVDGLIEWN